MKREPLTFWTCGAVLLGMTLIAAAASPLHADNAPAYSVLKTLPIPGDGGWDYLTLDPVSRRLYISHDTQVQVLDIDSYTIVAVLPNEAGVHGIALATEYAKGFVSNGKDGTVSIFDLITNRELSRLRVGENPDTIIFDTATTRVFTMNGKSLDATAIDARFNSIAGRISLGGRPDFAVSDGSGTLFVNLEDRGQLMSLDARRLRVKKHWAINGCFGPSSMAMDRNNGLLFIGCHNQKMVVVNADNGKVVAALPIGKNVDATVFDPDTQTIFNSNGEGTITMIHEDAPNKYHIVQIIPTQVGARTMAYDPVTRRIFLVTAQMGPIPTPTASHPRTRAPVKPGTFTLLVVGPTPPVSIPTPSAPAPLLPPPTGQPNL